MINCSLCKNDSEWYAEVKSIPGYKIKGVSITPPTYSKFFLCDKCYKLLGNKGMIRNSYLVIGNEVIGVPPPMPEWQFDLIMNQKMAGEESG